MALLYLDTLWYMRLIGLPMRARWKHRVVVLLLLLFAMDAGAVMAAGVHHCDKRCGCCDPFRHGGGAVQASHPMCGEHPMGDPPRESACCQPASVTGCDETHATNPALVPSSFPLRPISAPNLRVGILAATACEPPYGSRMTSHPYAAVPEAVSAVPIYLRTAVFLC